MYVLHCVPQTRDLYYLAQLNLFKFYLCEKLYIIKYIYGGYDNHIIPTFTSNLLV